MILPEPARCLYIFDEAHHLPIKSNNHFAASIRVRSTRAWLERTGDLIAQLLAEDFILVDSQSSFDKLQSILQHASKVLADAAANFSERGEIHDKRSRYTFPHGILPRDTGRSRQSLQRFFTTRRLVR